MVIGSCTVKRAITCDKCTVQLVSKFTARIGQNAYLARFFARHEKLHMFDAQVSRLLIHATMLESYAAHDLYRLTRIPTRDRFPVHVNLLASHISCNSYLRVYDCYTSEFMLTATLSGTLFTHCSLHKRSPHL